jgi:hypothetical protein
MKIHNQVARLVARLLKTTDTHKANDLVNKAEDAVMSHDWDDSNYVEYDACQRELQVAFRYLRTIGGK